MNDYDFDLIVIGSGPAGQSAAINAAKLDKRVALVERQVERKVDRRKTNGGGEVVVVGEVVVGGVMVNLGTIPSKTLREAVVYLSGYRERGVYGEAYRVEENITIADLTRRTEYVVRNEIDTTKHQLSRNRVRLIAADASFADPHTVRTTHVDGHGYDDFTAEKIVIATGTTATEAEGIPFDGESIFTADDVVNLDKLPRDLAVVGAGVIGLEYASMFATLGIRVTLVEKAPRLLPFVDSEIMEALVYHMRQNRVTVRLREEVDDIQPFEDERGKRVKLRLASGKQIVAEKALYSIGRTGATSTLNLEAIGVATDDRGRIKANDNHQTEQPHIYAVGDVIGFPSLASTSMEQGRLASNHAFGVEAHSVPELFPYGIYTIPEISMVGRNEDELTDEDIPYEVGKAQYREIARGQIIGDRTGLLKLIFHLDTLKLLGVHIIGEGASELVHIGQAVLSHQGELDYFVDTVFNYPTLAQAYKTAALDAKNRLGL